MGADHFKKWEIDFIIENYKLMSARQMAKELNRSESSIYNKISSLRLPRGKASLGFRGFAVKLNGETLDTGDNTSLSGLIELFKKHVWSVRPALLRGCTITIEAE